MAGLSDEVRERLNKGYSMYRNQLGDLINEALLEAAANEASDTAEGENSASVGAAIIAKLDTLPDLRDMMNSVLEKLDSLSTVAESIAPLSSSVGKLRDAVLAMAAKVDATATPADDFVDEVQALL